MRKEGTRESARLSPFCADAHPTYMLSRRLERCAYISVVRGFHYQAKEMTFLLLGNELALIRHSMRNTTQARRIE